MPKETKELEQEFLELELELDAQKEMISPPELMDEAALGEIMPTMSVAPLPEPPEEKCIVSDEVILGVFDEILNDIRDDRKLIDEHLGNVANMVFNEGDATSSTKEAFVNLVKLKSDQSDKKAKIAELMTRIKLKEKDTFPRYMAAHQHNNVTIESNNSKRDILKALQATQKKKDK